MINPSEENLLGYLIRANEEHEQEDLAEQIRTDAKLRQDCQLLQSGLALPAADEDHLDPPPLLAQRTCSLLWNKVDSGEFPKLPALAKPAAPDAIAAATSPDQAVSAQPVATPAAAALPVAMAAVSGEKLEAVDNTLIKPRQRWRWLDLAVASSVLVVIGGVLSTQILSSRTQSLRLGCQNNMQLTYAGLADYASIHDGRLPTAKESGRLAFAGMYGPTLRKNGHLRNERTLICPESAMAKNLGVHLPTLDEIEQATSEELPAMQKLAGGTNSYSLGYIENGKYHEIKLRPGTNFVLMSDPADSDNRPAYHHGQRGHNLLLSNGTVRYLSECCQVEGCKDDHFLNDDGEVAPGLHEDDAVLVPSGVGPLR